MTIKPLTQQKTSVDLSCHALAVVFIDEAFELGEIHPSVRAIDKEILYQELAGEIQQTIEDFLGSLKEDNSEEC